jgi:uncharacterized membrane protein YtjA (UPF0391 family)
MIRWAEFVLLICIAAAILGFTGVLDGDWATAAKVMFFVSLVAFVAIVIIGARSVPSGADPD